LYHCPSCRYVIPPFSKLSDANINGGVEVIVGTGNGFTVTPKEEDNPAPITVKYLQH